jgi:hypothetical protein
VLDEGTSLDIVFDHSSYLVEEEYGDGVLRLLLVGHGHVELVLDRVARRHGRALVPAAHGERRDDNDDDDDDNDDDMMLEVMV